MSVHLPRDCNCNSRSNHEEEEEEKKDGGNFRARENRAQNFIHVSLGEGIRVPFTRPSSPRLCIFAHCLWNARTECTFDKVTGIDRYARYGWHETTSPASLPSRDLTVTGLADDVSSRRCDFF